MDLRRNLRSEQGLSPPGYAEEPNKENRGVTMKSVLYNLMHKKGRLRNRALDVIENLSRRTVLKYHRRLIDTLLEVFEITGPNSQVSVRIGSNIVEYLIFESHRCSNMRFINFFNILGRHLAYGPTRFTKHYLKMARDTMDMARNLLYKSHFIMHYLVFLERHFPRLPNNIAKKAESTFELIVDFAKEYTTDLKQCLSTSLNLVQTGSRSLRQIVFKLLTTLYESITHSVKIVLKSFDRGCVRILSDVLNDHCVHIFRKRKFQDLQIPYLITLPASWFPKLKNDRGDDEGNVVCYRETDILVRFLHLICLSSVDIIQWLLNPEFNLTSTISTLLLYSEDEAVQGNALCILNIIISGMKIPEKIEPLKAIRESFKHMLTNAIYLEALVRKDKVKLTNIMEGDSCEILNDHRNRDPIQWAELLVDEEVVEFIKTLNSARSVQIDKSCISKQHDTDKLKVSGVKRGFEDQKILHDRCNKTRQICNLLYFSAEIMPILLIKYQQNFSEIYRHAILTLIQKMVEKLPGQILKEIIYVKVEGEAIIHKLCKIIKEAIRGEDNETSTMASTLNESLLKTLQYEFLHFARRYGLPIRETDCAHGPKPRKRAKCEDWDQNIVDLGGISRRIMDTCQLSNKQLALKLLVRHFIALKEFLKRSDLVVTPYEIQNSGLIKSLFMCFAVSRNRYWGQWKRGHNFESHHEYLLQRRNAFMQQFHKSEEFLTLLRLLVNTAEETEQFSIYLFETLPLMNGLEESSWRYSSKDVLLLRGRKFESNTSYEVLETILQWIPELAQSSAVKRTEHFLMERSFFLKLKSVDDNEVTYLRGKNEGEVEIKATDTINHLLKKYPTLIFDQWCLNGWAVFDPFYKDSEYSVWLQLNDSQQENCGSKEIFIQMSVCDWLGTCGGVRKCFINPVLLQQVMLISVPAKRKEINYESESFIGRSEIHNENHMKQLGKPYEPDLCDTTILEGEKIGSQIEIYFVFSLIPSAYCLSCIFDVERQISITNWCLQGTNDGINWVNLSVHINDSRPQGETVIFPLYFEEVSDQQKSYRAFRILDLSPLSKQGKMQVCGLDFFGKIVGPGHRLPYRVSDLDKEALESGVFTSLSLRKMYFHHQMKALKGGENYVPAQYSCNTCSDYRYFNDSDDEVIVHERCQSIAVEVSNFVNLSTKKRLPRLRFRLVAEDQERKIVVSTEIKNYNTPILKYATILAEKLVQQRVKSRTQLYLEYFLSDGSEKPSVTTNDVNEILHLIKLLHQMSSSFNEGINETPEGKEDESFKYHSQRLCKLIERQIDDSVAVGLSLIPHWCDGLSNQISCLIPYDLRVKLFRACAFGFPRSMKFIGEKKNREWSGSLWNLLKRAKVIKIPSNQSSENLRNFHDILHAYIELKKGMKSIEFKWTGTVGTTRALFRRDVSDRDGGKLFWLCAEDVFDRIGELKYFIKYRYWGEDGVGEGVNRDFYTELSKEFNRKSGFMWLNTSTDEDSLFVRTPFGLFPTPYPRPLVPLEVLGRFHILGISIARAIQDGYLMDLPLSKPFLKIILSYSRVLEVFQENEHADEMERAFSQLETLEKCRETTFSHLSFIDHWNLFESGSRHWLTGLLDLEDFLILYPHFENTLPGLLELCKRERKFVEAVKPCEAEQLNEFLDKNSEELLGCTLENLCLQMSIHCPSNVVPMTVKLYDIYPWESSGSDVTKLSEEEIECVSNDNYTKYIRRILEFCLDKGIRAQMEAFVAGFERVFPLKWLSMFTCREVADLINGQLADMQWIRDELQKYIIFSGFDENSKTVEYFLDALVGFNAEYRRKFLRYITGSSTLPVGGWKNLSPNLNVARHVTATGQEYPYSQSCFHKLFLREYKSFEELRESLIVAVNQVAFLLQ